MPKPRSTGNTSRRLTDPALRAKLAGVEGLPVLRQTGLPRLSCEKSMTEDPALQIPSDIESIVALPKAGIDWTPERIAQLLDALEFLTPTVILTLESLLQWLPEHGSLELRIDKKGRLRFADPRLSIDLLRPEGDPPFRSFLAPD